MGAINIFQMERSYNVSYFMRLLYPLLDESQIDIYFDEKKALPAACVPIAGVIDTLKEKGKAVKVHFSNDSYLGNIHFDQPYKVDEHPDSFAFPFSKYGNLQLLMKLLAF